MTDRELLEAAAKVAGLPHRWAPLLGKMLHIIDAGNCESWNPLEDDGEALRLAMALGMRVAVREAHADGGAIRITDPAEDYMQATRRAIVSAAAEIGRKA